MSPQAVGNFVHDLVEMAKAFDELPIVKANLAEAEASNERLSQTVGQREETILKLKSEIEAMQAKVREAEAGRDQAETMFLELDEKAHKVLRALASIQTEAADMERELNPPKPQPEPVAEAKPEPIYPSWSEHTTAIGADPNANRVEAHPTAEPSPIPTDASSQAAKPQAATSTGGADEGGERAANPTVQVQPSETGESAQSHGVESQKNVSQPTTTVSSGDSGVSVSPTPTTAPVDQTGTGMEPAQSGSEEPTKYEWVNGIKQVRQAWFDWYDSQPFEFKQAYDWN